MEMERLLKKVNYSFDKYFFHPDNIKKRKKIMIQTVLLSFIQSITEFLPVSSSGHLLLADAFGFSNQSLDFDAALHLGTLIAVVLYFYKDLTALLFGIWEKGVEQVLFFQLLIATVPVLCVGYFAKYIIETALRSPIVVAVTSIVFGLLLWGVDKYCIKTKKIKQLSYRGAFFIGLAQILALVPGTSRSGITITAARFLGLNRTDSTRFSMLLSIPTIFVAGTYALWEASRLQAGLALTQQMVWGIGLTAVFGLFAVWFLMHWVKRASFAVFALYRIVLGVFLIFFFL